jgi:hypothetical protein
MTIEVVRIGQWEKNILVGFKSGDDVILGNGAAGAAISNTSN